MNVESKNNKPEQGSAKKLKSRRYRLKRLLRSQFRRSFLAGLMVIIPLYFTIYIVQMFLSIGDNVMDLIPVEMRPPAKFIIPGMGLFIACMFTLAAGIIVRNVAGKFLYDYFNSLVERIPVVASLYSLFRQISEVFLGSNTNSFKQVILVEWPRRDSWMIAFVGGEAVGKPLAALEERTGANDFLNVFIPTTPNPTSGFYFMVRKTEVIFLDISIDRAFKLIVSGGTLSPETDTVGKRIKPK